MLRFLIEGIPDYNQSFSFYPAFTKVLPSTDSSRFCFQQVAIPIMRGLHTQGHVEVQQVPGFCIHQFLQMTPELLSPWEALAHYLFFISSACCFQRNDFCIQTCRHTKKMLTHAHRSGFSNNIPFLEPWAPKSFIVYKVKIKTLSCNKNRNLNKQVNAVYISTSKPKFPN